MDLSIDSTSYRAHAKSMVPTSTNKDEYIVLHYTGGGEEGALQHLSSDTSNVSAHYLIDKDGKVYQLADDNSVVYHAGNLDYNHKSIGIEFEMLDGKDEMTDAQKEIGAKLVSQLQAKYKIPYDKIIAHKDVPNATHTDLTQKQYDTFVNYLKQNNPVATEEKKR